MPLWQLVHRKKLSYPSAKRLPELRLDGIPSDSLVLSFRKNPEVRPDKVLRRISAISRIGSAFVASDVTLVGVESDSPVAPILMWDIAHALPVGAVLRVLDDVVDRPWLSRSYYAGALVPVERTSRGVVYCKEAPLPAEAGDLDSWTFGIPVGPEDAIFVNACVKRILELDIPRKEILLCGRPGDNFLYWDKVRIVGEDITAPPVQIARKKNRLAQEASHPNLCLLHDRVFLPRDFGKAVRTFGNAFPLTTFQSLYFDDIFNLVPRRYSDFNVGNRLAGQTIFGAMRNGTASRYAPAVFPVIDATDFAFANPHRYTRNTYPTGSLYIAKKSVWLLCPQNDSLMWTEFEDIEHAERAWEMGIPSRINPFGFSQSMNARPLLSQFGAVRIELRNGSYGMYRPFFDALPLPRKPLIKRTMDRALSELATFARNWAPNVDLPDLSASAIRSYDRIRTIIRLLHGTQLLIRRDDVSRFLKDFERHVVGDQLPYAWHEHMLQQIREKGKHAFHGNAIHDGILREIINQTGQRHGRYVFAKTFYDYFPRRSKMVAVGSLISALLLGFQNHRAFYFPGGWLWRYRMLLGTTPYRDYADAPTMIGKTEGA